MEFPTDASGWRIHFRDCHNLMRISLEQVQANFQRYGLLDDQVRFLKGWFKDTLPSAPIGKLAMIRLDGDMYESTMDGLVNLYPKLSPGGCLIVDDYGAISACRKAVHDYREQHGIHEEIHSIDWTGVYWRRSAAV
jgi:O-methyltransferase